MNSFDWEQHAEILEVERNRLLDEITNLRKKGADVSLHCAFNSSPVRIAIAENLPDGMMDTGKPEVRNFYDREAKIIFDALYNHLPSGTYERLFQLMKMEKENE